MENKLKKIILKGCLLSACAGMALQMTSVAGDWASKDGNWYYVENGDLAKGWVKDRGYWYYFDETGAMLSGMKQIDGNWYKFNVLHGSYTPFGALLDQDSVTVTESFYGEYPFLTLTRPGNDKSHVLIMLHGLSGSRTDYLNYAAELADLGFYVILPQAYCHIDNPDTADFADIITCSSDMLDGILDKCGITDSSDLSLFGVSMGGMTASYYAVHGKRKPDRLILMISTPDFKALSNDIFFKVYCNGAAVADADRDMVIEKLSEISPKEDLSKMDLPVTIIESDNDPIIPENGSSDGNTTIIQGTMTGHKVSNDDFQAAISILKGVFN